MLRLLPGAIDDASTVEESFSHGLLEYPQYTRPPVFGDLAVPDILISGHHGAVAAWRHEQALERTRRRRPDLLREPAAASLLTSRAGPRPPTVSGSSTGDEDARAG